MKNRIKELWKEYKKKRKENRVGTITGYLDFGYEVMQTVINVYQTFFLLMGILYCFSVEQNQVNELAEIIGSRQGMNVLLSYIMFICIIVYMMWFILKDGIRLLRRITVIICWYGINTVMLSHGINIFSLKGTFAVILSAFMIEKILMTVMKVKRLPSKYISYHHTEEG